MAEVFQKKDGLDQRRRALGKRCRIERRCGYNRPLLAARKCAFENGKAKRVNQRSLSVLRDGEDGAIILLRRWTVTIVIMAMLLVIGVFVSMDVCRMMLGRRGKLLEKMVHRMRCGGDQEKPKSSRHTQV